MKAHSPMNAAQRRRLATLLASRRRPATAPSIDEGPVPAPPRGPRVRSWWPVAIGALFVGLMLFLAWSAPDVAKSPSGLATLVVVAFVGVMGMASAFVEDAPEMGVRVSRDGAPRDRKRNSRRRVSADNTKGTE